MSLHVLAFTSLMDGLPYDILYIDTSSESSTAGVLIEEQFNCENFLPCDPRRKPHRCMLFFLFMCMLMFGRYYCYDNPNALQSTIIKVSAK